MASKKPKDVEFAALERCVSVLNALPPEQAARVLDYLNARFAYYPEWRGKPNSPDA
jgi:hypothetical protein